MSPVPYILVLREHASCYSCLAAPNTVVFYSWGIFVTLAALGCLWSWLAATATLGDESSCNVAVDLADTHLISLGS
jgi:hypothetical protein